MLKCICWQIINVDNPTKEIGKTNVLGLSSLNFTNFFLRTALSSLFIIHPHQIQQTILKLPILNFHKLFVTPKNKEANNVKLILNRRFVISCLTRWARYQKNKSDFLKTLQEGNFKMKINEQNQYTTRIKWTQIYNSILKLFGKNKTNMFHSYGLLRINFWYQFTKIPNQ